MIEINPSPIQTIRFRGRSFWIKRDDLLHPILNGNKARKFHTLLHTPSHLYRRIISHGSIQSNALYALSYLTKQKGWHFDYYVKTIPKFLKCNPHGNYLYALRNGARIIENQSLPEVLKEGDYFIPEGGAMSASEVGITVLAEEITDQVGEENPVIFLPSGTGTTAYYLQKHLPYEVVTTPLVGDEAYLLEQFRALEGEGKRLPTILESQKKYYFGKLYREFVEIWVELRQTTKLTFDLLYDPKGWLVLMAHLPRFEGRSILYLHQGGLSGNESLLKRYKREFDEDFI